MEATLIEVNQQMEIKFARTEMLLAKSVTDHDMGLNFEKLNDILFVKFKQLEDTKTAVRDLLAYQKYFYPMQL